MAIDGSPLRGRLDWQPSPTAAKPSRTAFIIRALKPSLRLPIFEKTVVSADMRLSGQGAC